MPPEVPSPSTASDARRTSKRHAGAALLTVGMLGVLLAPSLADAAQAPVGLGTAESFAVLAGSGITNTGPTTNPREPQVVDRAPPSHEDLLKAGSRRRH